MASGCADTRTIRSDSVFWTVPFDPLTCAVKKTCAANGVPEITPAELSESPAGSPPYMTLQVQPMPQPGAVNVWLYAAPRCPAGARPPW